MIHKTLFSMPKLLWGGVMLFIEVITKPTLGLMYVVAGAIVLDFLTGVAKAVMKKEARTSEGYRKTVIKFMQYIIPIVLLWLASYRIPNYKQSLQEMAGWLMLFVLYIEFTSIMENLYEIDKKSVIAKYLYRPALKILKFGIHNNPVTKAADKLDEDKKEPEKP